MQDTLLRYRRRDFALRVGTLTMVLGIAAIMAAPQMFKPPSAQTHGDVPLFTPYRTAEVAAK
ncbi:MAG TPA: hypothetical protein VGA77_17135 [Propylenella sp.]|jgi:hypothetical protein